MSRETRETSQERKEGQEREEERKLPKGLSNYLCLDLFVFLYKLCENVPVSDPHVCPQFFEELASDAKPEKEEEPVKATHTKQVSLKLSSTITLTSPTVNW